MAAGIYRDASLPTSSLAASAGTGGLIIPEQFDLSNFSEVVMMIVVDKVGRKGGECGSGCRSLEPPRD